MRGQLNTVASKQVEPRVSVLMGICTDGKMYCSLTQINTDQNVFCVFISKLASKLTNEDRNWRDNTLLLIDGARYQTSKESIEHMRQLGFKVCVSAPYSFSGAAIEFAFSLLKSKDLNPSKLKTGKK